MLVSHQKQFIFIKTIKTAGTSVESYFEKYCMPEGEWVPSHHRSELVSEFGIIGYRGPQKAGTTWHPHMSADSIRQMIGEEVWRSYFKFTVMRNPYDKLVSAYHMAMRKKRARTQTLVQRLKYTLLRKQRCIDKAKGRTDVERFRNWMHCKQRPFDRNKYLIDGEVCVDYFIRFENLQEGIREVCHRLAIPYEAGRIPEFKTGLRDKSIPVRDYYEESTQRLIEAQYAWELREFGYQLPA